MSLTRFQCIIIIIIVILYSLQLWNCWNCPIWCLMTCVYFSNYLIHCHIWPISIEIDATWCIFVNMFLYIHTSSSTYLSSTLILVVVLLSNEDISNRLWHRRISHVSGRSPLVSQAQSSSPLLSYIIKSIMFMDLLWEVYTSSQYGSGSWI